MLTKLPRASEAEIEKASIQIANALRTNLRWHANFTRMTAVPQVQTNIGTFIYYGLSQPREVQKIGDVAITKAFPHSLNLIAVTKLPTSAQKVLLLEAIAMRVVRKLGAPSDAIVERKDPTIRQALTIELAKLEGEDRVEETDPYKVVTEPFSISIRWAAPEES